MNVTFQLDPRGMRDLQAGLRQYQRATRKSSVAIVNQAAFWVAKRAFGHTIYADKARLAAELGASVTRLSGGRIKTKTTKARLTSVANARFVARQKRLGLPVPKGAALVAAVARYVANTLRSVTFMRAGWASAIRRLGQLVHAGAGVGTKTGFGGCVPGRELGDMAVAEIFNASTSRVSPTSEWALATYAGPALDIAIAEEAADKWEYAERELAKNAAEFNR